MAKRKDSRSASGNTTTLTPAAATPEVTIMAPSEPVTLSDAPTLAPSMDMKAELIGPRIPEGYVKPTAAEKAPVETLSKIAAEISAAPKMPVGPNVPLPQAAPKAEAPAVSTARPVWRMAATVAIAAGIGALLGAGGVSAYSKLTAAPAVYTVEAPSKTAKLESDIAALKASLEASAKTTNGQFGKLAERLERAEKAQAEPVAKMTKLSDKINDALERFDQRLAAASAPETTGSIAPAQSQSRSFAVAAADPKADKLQDKLQTSPAQPVIAGWVLRDIFDGRALVESRYGMYEVGPGGNLPGIGRVASIKRQDGRWVVTTPKGVIVSER